MVEVSDPQGKALLRMLLVEHPEWSDHVVAGEENPAHPNRALPRLLVPSEHPTIKTPLTIELGGTLQLFWHGGYFFDFVGLDQHPCVEAAAFLRRFFAEEVLCSTFWKDGKVVAGGPIEADEWREWPVHEDKLELRSWRGTHDRNVCLS
jgi:hypothetical protein